RHDVRHQGDNEQCVAKLGAASDRGRPIAGIHIADSDEVTGADKGGEPSPHAARTGYPDRAEDVYEGRFAAVASPAWSGSFYICHMIAHRKCLALAKLYCKGIYLQYDHAQEPLT